MPDDENSSSDEVDLKTGKKKEPVKFNKRHLEKIRKSIAKGKLAKRSSIVEKYVGKEIKAKYKTPVKSKYKPGQNNLPPRNTGEPGSTGNIKDIIDLARKGNQGFKMGNRLKKKLQGKRR